MKAHLTVRIDQKLLEMVRERATREHRSLGSALEQFLLDALRAIEPIKRPPLPPYTGTVANHLERAAVGEKFRQSLTHAPTCKCSICKPPK